MEPRLLADLEGNADRFVRRVLAGQSVYFAESDDGLLTCDTVDGAERTIVVFWSDAAYVRDVLRRHGDEGAGYAVKSESLATFLFHMLPRFDTDGVLIGPNYTPETMAGVELEPHAMFKRINDAMSDEQRDRYIDLSKSLP
jgi:hypothetical protein